MRSVACDRAPLCPSTANPALCCRKVARTFGWPVMAACSGASRSSSWLTHCYYALYYPLFTRPLTSCRLLALSWPVGVASDNTSDGHSAVSVAFGERLTECTLCLAKTSSTVMYFFNVIHNNKCTTYWFVDVWPSWLSECIRFGIREGSLSYLGWWSRSSGLNWDTV